MAFFRVPQTPLPRNLLGLAIVSLIALAAVAGATVLARPLGLGTADDFVFYKWFELSRGDVVVLAGSLFAAISIVAIGIVLNWQNLPGFTGARTGMGLTDQDQARRPTSLLANAALVAASTVTCVFVAEAGVRLVDGIALWPPVNHIAKEKALLTTQTGNAYHPILGWVLRAGIGGNSQDPETSFTTGEHGVRMNSNEVRPVPQGAILAVGDSFTAGSEVGDRYSWPAQLERLLGSPVVNAAAGGWASDQIVLRAEELAPILKPSTIVVSFLADDILRSGFRVYGSANKPWFDVDDNGDLVHHNNPVPRFTGKPGETNASWFGYFYIIPFVMDRLGMGDILRRGGTEYIKNGNDPVAVSCKLLERAHKTFSSQDIKMIFMLQHGGSDNHPTSGHKPHADAVVACAREAGIVTIDTWPPLLVEYEKGFGPYKELFVMHDDNRLYGHMSAKGNALIADLVAAEFAN